MAGEYAGPEGFRRVVQSPAALFNEDSRLLTSLWLARIQEDLELLKGLLDRVGLWTKVDNTVGMVCQPCRNAGSQAEESYT